MTKHTITTQVPPDEELEALDAEGKSESLGGEITTDDDERAAWLADHAARQIGNDRVTVVSDHPELADEDPAHAQPEAEPKSRPKAKRESKE
jgi:hypothetical protein